MLIEIHLLRRL
jgi:putative ABC transport system ATP-binding protein